MANPIKYNISSETRALNTGNFWIGTGDADKGPTSNTGYYVGPNIPSGGYVIYLYKDSQPGDLAYHKADNDSELILFTNKLAGTSYTTVNECLNYFATQDDKVCFNRDYEDIVTDELIFSIDAAFTPSYPKNGSTAYDLGNSVNGTLTNSPSFSTNNGGTFTFDGTDEYISLGDSNNIGWDVDNLTLEVWIKSADTGVGSNQWCAFIGTRYGKDIQIGRYSSTSNLGILATTNNYNINLPDSGITVFDEQWHHCVCVFDGGIFYVYVDGTLEQTYSNRIGQSLTPSSSTFGVGGSPHPSSPRFFDGDIPIARIYNKSLSSIEVSQNYTALSERFGL